MRLQLAMRQCKQRCKIIPILSTTRTIRLLQQSQPPKVDTWERQLRYRDVVKILDIEVEPAVDGEMLLAGAVVVKYRGHSTIGAFSVAFICTGVLGVCV